jgi:hypothetical protein
MSVLCLCALVGLYYRGAQKGSMIYLFWLVFITLIVETIGLYYLKVLGKVAGLVYAIFQPVEYTLMAIFFFLIIKSSIIKSIIKISIPFVLIWNIINSLFFQSINGLNTYALLVVSLLFCSWTVVYFLQLLNSFDDEKILWKNPYFWVCTGVLFFYAGSFFLTCFINFILKNDSVTANKIWPINHMLNIVMYSLYTYGFICQAKYQK